jgi:iron complex outermembrane receptor protein
VIAFAIVAAPSARPDDPPAPDEPPVELPEVVVRAPRAEATEDPHASATVIRADRFAGEAKEVAELVATAPGVAVNGYGGLGGFATASIRGATADGVRILLDGLPLNTAFGGGVDLSTIPRHWISRVEVVRGVAGARFGAGALGGVLDVSTRPAHAGGWSAEAAGGSLDTWSVSADGARRLGALDVLAAGSAERTTGDFRWEFDHLPNVEGRGEEERIRWNNGARRASGLLKLGGPAAGGRADALFHVSGGHRDLPAAPQPSEPPVRDWQDDARALAMLRLSDLALAPSLRVAARIHGRLDLLDVEIGDTLSRQRGGAAGLDVEAALAHRGGTVRLAGEAGGDLLHATGTGERRSRGTIAATLSEDASLAGGRVRLGPALRVERQGAFSGWSAQLGGAVQLTRNLSARANAGRTFRAPSFAELYLRQGLVRPNPGLAPEEAFGGDAALVLDGPLGMASAGAYATLYRDLILYDRVSLGFLQPRNTGKARVSGIELEAASTPWRRALGLAAAASYTLLASRNLRGEEEELGRWLPHRARHRLYARVSLSPGPALLHVETHYVGRQYEDTRNELPVDAALVWNAGVQLRIPARPALALALTVRNALDDRTLEDPIGNPLPGRVVMLTLRAGATAKEGTP